MDYSSEQIAQQEYEIDSNPELQRSEFAPVAKEEMFHEKVYKTLVTLGDFMCYVWFYDHDYDDKRTVKGSKRIHIVPSEERIEDSLEINKYFNIANDVWSEGVIYVNAIFRRNGTAFTSNKDLKDCVKYFSGVAAHYGADKDKIIAIDIADNEKMYEMSYDSLTSNTYADVSNNVYSDFTSIPIGNGSLSLSYTRVFQVGPIEMSDLNTEFSLGNNIGAYYRGAGGGIADIPENGAVPTLGNPISYSNLRQTVKKITANANGNWQHLQAKWEIYGESAYASSLEKVLNVNGFVGSGANTDPAIRFHSGGGGDIKVYLNAGNSAVRGYSGEGGNAGGGDGSNGGVGMVVATPIQMPQSHYNDRLRGGGGGGGGGGQGGQGGGGGHSGHRVCRGWFCNSSYLVCHGNGGTGGQAVLAVLAAEETASTGMVLLGLEHTLMEKVAVLLEQLVKVEIVEEAAKVVKAVMEAMAVAMKQMVLTEIQEIQETMVQALQVAAVVIQAVKMVRQALAVVVRELERPELPMVAAVQ